MEEVQLNNPLNNLSLSRNKMNNLFLEELVQSIEKFSNSTLGKETVEYYLIGTKHLADDGSISISTDDVKKNIGNAKSIQKYRLNKGDIIIPHRGHFKSIGVMTKETDIPYVGHHGLLRISCGGDNLDLAFYIKDYLLLSNIRETIPKSGLTIDFLKKLLIPTNTKDLKGYMENSIKINRTQEVLAQLNTHLMSNKHKILINAFTKNVDANSKNNVAINNILGNTEEALLLSSSKDFICNDDDFDLSLNYYERKRGGEA